MPICASIPCGAERREHLVAPLDLDHVGLPAVDVALVRRGQRRPAGRARRSAYAAAMRVRAASSSSSRRSCGRPTAQRMSDEAVVEPGLGHVGVGERAPAVVAQPARPRRRCRSSSVVIAPPSPVVTILRGWKLRQPIRPSEPQARPRRRAPSAPAASSTQRQVGQLLDPAPAGRRGAPAMHGLRPRPDLDPRRVEVHRLRVDVDEHRPQAGERDDVRRRREGVRGHEHLVAGLEPEREHREVERRRARRDRDRVLGLARPRELLARTRRRAGPS